MTKEEIIRNLKYTMEKHKNDIVNTFDTNISVMCKDILNYLEQEPVLNKIRDEIEQLPITDAAIRLVTEIIEMKAEREDESNER